MLTEIESARFWAKVDEAGTYECWPWNAAKRNGYGRFALRGRVAQAHRVAYEDRVGLIPGGLHLDHLCRNPACCNPIHLQPVPHAENVRRGVSPHAHNARKTHCKHGHEFTPENTYRSPVGRHCKTCRRIARAAYYARPEKRAARIAYRRARYIKSKEGTRAALAA